MIAYCFSPGYVCVLFKILSMKLNNRLQQSLLLLTTAMTILMSACTKEGNGNNPGTDPGPNGQKLSKIEHTDGSFEAIEYNTNGSIKKITNSIKYTGSTQVNIFTFAYANDRLSELIMEDGSKMKYVYTGQVLSKLEFYEPGGNMITYYELTFKDGKLWRSDAFYRIPGTPGGISSKVRMRTELEYQTNGNIKKTMLYFRDPMTDLLEKTDEYVMQEYDNKRNTTVLFENNPFILLDYMNNFNNPLKVLHYNGAGHLDETTTYAYTYNSQGNPITRKTVTVIPGSPDDVEEVRLFY